MYHWRDGLWFMRHDDGNVEIFKYEGFPPNGHKTTTIAVIPENEWASIVCSVSKEGETGERWMQARHFHGLAVENDKSLERVMADQLADKSRRLSPPASPVREREKP